MKTRQSIWEEGRTAWPDVEVCLPEFCRYLDAQSEKQGAGSDRDSYLQAVCAADLYLACACLLGNPAAIAAFDRTCLSQVPKFLGDMASDSTLVDEVKQQLRECLLVGTSASPAQLAGYSGRGALHMWLRITALRVAWKLKGRGDIPVGDAADLPVRGALQESEDPELRYLKDRYRQDFEQAIRDAFLLLQSKQRNLLRLRHLEGLSDEKIGALYRAHQSTVTRWMAQLHADLLKQARRLLRERLHVSSEEFESLVGLVRSRIDLNMGGLLQQTLGGNAQE